MTEKQRFMKVKSTFNGKLHIAGTIIVEGINNVVDNESNREAINWAKSSMSETGYEITIIDHAQEISS